MNKNKKYLKLIVAYWCHQFASQMEKDYNWAFDRFWEMMFDRDKDFTELCLSMLASCHNLEMESYILWGEPWDYINDLIELKDRDGLKEFLMHDEFYKFVLEDRIFSDSSLLKDVMNEVSKAKRSTTNLDTVYGVSSRDLRTAISICWEILKGPSEYNDLELLFNESSDKVKKSKEFKDLLKDILPVKIYDYYMNAWGTH